MDEHLTRAERHRRWLAGFGLSPRDWSRIKRLAEQTSLEVAMAALDDLDAPVRVGAVIAGEEGRYSGRLLGSWRGRALLYWTMTEREQEVWRRRRRDGRNR